MAKFAANYRVTLRSELPAREAAFVSALGAEVAGPKGEPLYLPHELILVVSGSADAFPAGFGS